MSYELRTKAAALATLALLWLSAGGNAAQPRECPAIDVPVPAAAASGRPAFRAFVDPATGKLREPTADELRQLAEERLRSRATSEPRVFEIVTHPDGMKSVDLGDAFLFDVRVEKLPDGSTKTVCAPHARPAAGTQK
jgi:hypothetical protein